MDSTAHGKPVTEQGLASLARHFPGGRESTWPGNLLVVGRPRTVTPLQGFRPPLST
jgi:hypothetical protein